MDQALYRIYTRGVTGLISCAVAVYALVELGRSLPELGAAAGSFLILLLPAMVAARIAATRPSDFAPRGALIFVLAGITLLPAPGGLALALGASVAGMGRGVAGTFRGGWIGFTALAVAVAVTEHVSEAFPLFVDVGSPAVLLPLTLQFIVIHGFALGLGMALDSTSVDGLVHHPERAWRGAALEGACVPLAWFLAMLVQQRSFLAAAGFSALVLITLEALQRLEGAQSELRRASNSLSSRVSELAVLHDIGRDILASMNPERVYRLLDRESRKFLDVHACSVALADPDSGRLRRVFTRDETGTQIGEVHVPAGLALRVLHQKRPLRVGNITELPPDGSLRANLLDSNSRSAMAVPLIVEERVVGVLTVESERANAYDDHQLAMLTTIGQQVAVAIEGARHYNMARVDSLTGFFVKDYFFRRLDEEDTRARRYGGKFAILMVDLDSFKGVNDTYGHLAGDRFLHEITATIREQLRGADLACRYGGDEFCLLLPESDLEAAQATAERIREAVSRRIVAFDGVALRTTVSVGVAAYPEHDTGSLQGMMQNADQALYRAKRSGRDRVEPFAA